MRIGYIENLINNRYILFWFYQYRNGVWKKIWTEEIPVGGRDRALQMFENKNECVLEPLSHVR